MSRARILTGDCLDLMPTLDADSVDAIVTDPPYGLSFMGKDWDHNVAVMTLDDFKRLCALPGNATTQFEIGDMR